MWLWSTKEEREEALRDAAAAGKLADVQSSLNRRVDINCKGEELLTPLHKATFFGHVDVVRLLLKNHADVDAKSTWGDTPLHYATFRNSVESVRLLLEKGANVNAKNAELETPLHVASKYDYVDVVRLLLAHGAHLHATTKSKRTPLMLAQAKDHVQVQEVLKSTMQSLQQLNENTGMLLLLDSVNGNHHEPDGTPSSHLVLETPDLPPVQIPNLQVDANDSTMETALTDALAAHNIEAAYELLYASAQLEAVDTTTVQAQMPILEAVLRHAALNSNTPVVEALLCHGVSPAATNEQGETALHLAAANGHTAVVQTLLQHDTSLLRRRDQNDNAARQIAVNGHNCIDATNQAGESPLFVAAANGHVDVVKALVQANAKTHCVSNDGSTLLHAAAIGGNRLVLDQVCSLCSNLETCDERGQTPLHVAAAKGRTSAVQYLVTAKANVFAKTTMGQTPLMLAANEAVVALLTTAESDAIHRASQLSKAVQHQKWTQIDSLLDAGADPNGAPSTDEPLPAAAMRCGNLVIAKRMLSSPQSNLMADRDAAVARTLFSLALATEQLELARSLVQTDGNANGSAALDAMLGRLLQLRTEDQLRDAARDGHRDDVTSLLASHPTLQLNAKDADGKTALQLAVANGHVAIVAALLVHDPSTLAMDTSLQLAARLGNVHHVDTLVQALVPEYELETLAPMLATAFFEAKLRGHDDIVQVLEPFVSTNALRLLSYEANSTTIAFHATSTNDVGGRLAAAIQAQDWTTTKALLSEGIPVSTVDDTLTVILDHVIAANDTDVLRCLLTSFHAIERSAASEMCQKVLLAAVQHDKPRLVMVLLHDPVASAMVRVVSTTCPSPLHKAAARGDAGLVALLLASPSADIDATNKNKYTPLALAVEQGHDDVVRALVSFGADVSTPLPNGSPVLHVAATGHGSTMLEVLLQAPGLAINQLDHDKYTALARAVMAGQSAAVRLLLEHGADAWIPLPNEQTVLAAAVKDNHRDIAHLLYTRMYPSPPTLKSTDDLVLGELLKTQGEILLYKATYRGKAVVLKGPRYSQKRITKTIRDEVEEMRGCTSPYVQPLIAILDNGSTTALLSLPSGGALYSPTIVMEYMDGGDLHDTLKKTHDQSAPVQVSTIDVALVLAHALRDIHALRKVHRDVKSLNIFLSSTYYIRLGDLGSARTMDDSMTTGVGTKFWMAPEVLRSSNGGPSYGPPADIYSFGVVLTELDTRETPYGDVANQNSIPDQVRNGAIRPTMSANCAPWLRALADQCLAYDPSQRPTAEDIIAKLLAHRHDNDVP